MLQNTRSACAYRRGVSWRGCDRIALSMEKSFTLWKLVRASAVRACSPANQFCRTSEVYETANRAGHQGAWLR